MIKAFLFDKDGTLIDFKSVWLPVTKKITRQMIQQYGRSEQEVELLSAIGIKGEYIEGTGILATKTVVDVARVWHDLLDFPPQLEVFTEEVSRYFYKEVEQHIYFVEMFPAVKETLVTLKDRGFILGLVTADSEQTTLLMLEHLKIKELFDYIGTEDGITLPKPNSAHMDAFCKKTKVKPSEVVMVGDTRCDMVFGKNSGARTIGVLSGMGQVLELQREADYVIPSVASLREEKAWPI